MKKIFKKYSSFEEAEKDKIEEYKSMTASEKLNELIHLLNIQNKNELQQGLQRVCRIIKLK